MSEEQNQSKKRGGENTFLSKIGQLMAKTLVRSTFLTERARASECARASEHARDEQFMMSNSTSVISNHSK